MSKKGKGEARANAKRQAAFVARRHARDVRERLLRATRPDRSRPAGSER